MRTEQTYHWLGSENAQSGIFLEKELLPSRNVAENYIDMRPLKKIARDLFPGEPPEFVKEAIGWLSVSYIRSYDLKIEWEERMKRVDQSESMMSDKIHQGTFWGTLVGSLTQSANIGIAVMFFETFRQPLAQFLGTVRLQMLINETSKQHHSLLDAYTANIKNIVEVPYSDAGVYFALHALKEFDPEASDLSSRLLPLDHLLNAFNNITDWRPNEAKKLRFVLNSAELINNYQLSKIRTLAATSAFLFSETSADLNQASNEMQTLSLDCAALTEHLAAHLRD